MSEQAIEVVAVESSAQLRQFVELPYRIYSDDPNWVAPLKLLEKHRFDEKRPYFQHARAQAFLALKDGVPVGRISAQVDDLHQQRYQDKTGYFGLPEAIDDDQVFAALFDAAERWLKEQGMSRVRGPYNLSINEEVGVLVEGFETPQYIMMGHGRPYYDAGIKAQGYRGAKDLLAYLIDTDFVAPPVMEKLVRRAQRKVTVRTIRMDSLEEEAEIMRDIHNDAWQNNWGFVPFTQEEFLDTVKTLTMLLPPEQVQIAEHEGEPAAFIVMLPNINEAIADLKGSLFPFGWLKAIWRLKVKGLKTGRVPLMGVRTGFQNGPLGPVMAFMVIDAVRSASVAGGMQKTEMGWILEDNQAMNNIILQLGGDPYKRYRMYEKDLT